MCHPSLRSAALVLAGVLVWGSGDRAANAAPPVNNTAAYAPGSVGYYSVPAFNYFPSFNGSPYVGYGTNLVAPYYYPYYGPNDVDYSYPPPIIPGYTNNLDNP